MVSEKEILDFVTIHYDWLSIFGIILIFSILSMRYFRNKAERKREPIFLLILAIVLGVLSVVPSLILSLLILVVVPESLGPVVVAPIAEEIGKGLLLGFIAKTRLVETPLDGLVYGAMIGTGFSAAENFLYAYSALSTDGYAVGLLVVTFRSAFQIIGHPLYAGITGYGMGLFKAGRNGRKYNKIWLAMLLHALWNSTTVFFSDYWLPAFLGVIAFSLILMRIITSRAQSLV